MQEDTASSTAFTVLQGVLFTARRAPYDRLVEPAAVEAARRILRASDEGRRRLAQLDSMMFRTLAPWAERALMPGISTHYVVRKRFMADAAAQAIADGYQQIVNLGAGFDVLAWTLHRAHPEVTFIEIDHPATSRVKQQAIGQDELPNLHFLAVDLGEKSLAEVLGGFPNFDPARKTLFVCEGVMMYLDVGAVEALFAAVATLSGPGTRLAFTAVSPIGSAHNNTGLLLRLYLAMKREPLAWALEPAALQSFVEAQGYRLLDGGDTSELIRRYLPDGAPGPRHRGEFMALAEASG